MILMNKKTGKMVAFGAGIIDLTRIGCRNVGEMIEAGWEDYKEPKVKKYYWISPLDCGVVEDDLIWNKTEYDDEIDEFNVKIGNYFETEEEAKLAVEKLKALKRLKDKGFKFNGYDSGHNSDKELCGQAYFKAGNFWFDIKDDLDLLFGGEK